MPEFDTDKIKKAYANWVKDDRYAKDYSPEEYRFSSDVTGGFFDDRATGFYAGYMAALNGRGK